MRLLKEEYDLKLQKVTIGRTEEVNKSLIDVLLTTILTRQREEEFSQLRMQYERQLETLHNELARGKRYQAEMEDKIERLTSDLRFTKNDYEAQINSLKAELAKQKQIENDLRVLTFLQSSSQNMQYQLLEQHPASKSEGENVRLKIDNIRLRTLETDILMLRQELADTNAQKTTAETELEKSKHQIRRLKEDTVKELERKYSGEIKELKHMIYLLTKTKDYTKNLQVQEAAKQKTVGKRTAPVHDRLEEYTAKIVSLEKECENLHHDNYRLAQEIQYLEFKLKVVVQSGTKIERNWDRGQK
eukprot:TRINITY_DN1283_c0_g1_i1.p1 TRINITY_DN1283_c0_g1~~TRINITY_DN1283_c0_g1_i1.p1  ORF type:complete len:302 (+),score=33.55 TRINITY_DN1283_c0_g1_i1:1220-2125(+)